MSSTSIFVQWDQVPLPYQNGVVLYYTVTYRLYYNGLFPQTVVVAAPTTQVTLTGLNQSTLYWISLSASTSKGRGPSTSIDIATGKNRDFPFISLLEFNGEENNNNEKGKESQYRKLKGEGANRHAIT